MAFRVVGEDPTVDPSQSRRFWLTDPQWDSVQSLSTQMESACLEHPSPWGRFNYAFIDTRVPILDVEGVKVGDVVQYNWEVDGLLGVVHVVDTGNPSWPKFKLWTREKYGQIESRWISARQIQCFFPSIALPDSIKVRPTMFYRGDVKQKKRCNA